MKGLPSFAGISGGRTSGMMAALLPPGVVLSFQNTGREHPATYDFLGELEQNLERPIVWLEYRPPKRLGGAPRESRFAIVNYKTAARDGSPFRLMLEALREYRRKEKGLGPVAPWARSRLCTAYLKWKTLNAYVLSLGVDANEQFIGLRADEPERVARMLDRETSERTFRFPLHAAKLTVKDVGAFWDAQSFDLRIRGEYQGNCTACFLKDQGDISRSLAEDEADARWWVDIARDFPDFGGRNFPGYDQLLREVPVRTAIEASLKTGVEPLHDSRISKERFRLVLIQEKKRFAGERTAFSCNCEPGEID